MMIRVVIPHYMGLSSATRRGLADLKTSGIPHMVVQVESTFIYSGRNAGIVGHETSLAHPELPDFTHVLQLDSDIGFSASDVLRLLDHDLPIVSGAYRSRVFPDCYNGGGYRLIDGNYGGPLPSMTTGLHTVRWVGAGFLLIKRDVFETIAHPWFLHDLLNYTDDNGVSHRLHTGEDIGFCLQAERVGYTIHLDCDCVVDHITNKSEAYHMTNSGNSRSGVARTTQTNRRTKMTINDICQEITDCVALLKRELMNEKQAHEATKKQLAEATEKQERE